MGPAWGLAVTEDWLGAERTELNDFIRAFSLTLHCQDGRKIGDWEGVNNARLTTQIGSKCISNKVYF